MVYKAVCSLTWIVNSDEPIEKITEDINKLISNEINFNFTEFKTHLALMPMRRGKNQVKHLAKFPVETILPLMNLEVKKEEFVVGNKTYLVKMKSDRYSVFKDNKKCVVCGVEGKHMILDVQPDHDHPHFNLYAEEESQLILMTKDHITPKSKGGRDQIENYQTMCSICNNIKSDDEDMTFDAILEIKALLKNKYKFTNKEIKAAMAEIKSKKEEKLSFVSPIKYTTYEI